VTFLDNGLLPALTAGHPAVRSLMDPLGSAHFSANPACEEFVATELGRRRAHWRRGRQPTPAFSRRSATVLIGKNNTGKSVFLRAIYAIQDQIMLQQPDIRIGLESMTVQLALDGLPQQIRSGSQPVDPGVITLSSGTERDLTVAMVANGTLQPAKLLSVTNQEPSNLFIPVLSGRRPSYYREQAGAANAYNVSAQDSWLVSRVLPVAGTDIPEAHRFSKLCKEILGVNFDIYGVENDMRRG
jgi:hypothetical protein